MRVGNLSGPLRGPATVITNKQRTLCCNHRHLIVYLDPTLFKISQANLSMLQMVQTLFAGYLIFGNQIQFLCKIICKCSIYCTSTTICTHPSAECKQSITIALPGLQAFQFRNKTFYCIFMYTRISISIKFFYCLFKFHS